MIRRWPTPYSLLPTPYPYSLLLLPTSYPYPYPYPYSRVSIPNPRSLQFLIHSNYHSTVEHHRKLAILVGGGPAPGINSVIGAATIRAELEGLEVIGLRDGFEWIMQGDIDHVMPLTIERQPHPFPRRLAHRHLAREPDDRPAATSRTP